MHLRVPEAAFVGESENGGVHQRRVLDVVVPRGIALHPFQSGACRICFGSQIDRLRVVGVRGIDDLVGNTIVFDDPQRAGAVVSMGGGRTGEHSFVLDGTDEIDVVGDGKRDVRQQVLRLPDACLSSVEGMSRLVHVLNLLRQLLHDQ